MKLEKIVKLGATGLLAGAVFGGVYANIREDIPHTYYIAAAAIGGSIAFLTSNIIYEKISKKVSKLHYDSIDQYLANGGDRKAHKKAKEMLDEFWKK